MTSCDPIVAGSAWRRKSLRPWKRRAANHLAERRLGDALRDCERAVVLGGNQPRLAELRTHAASELSRQQNQQSLEQQMVDEARRRIADGELTMGRQLCQQLPDTTARRDYLAARNRSAAIGRGIGTQASGNSNSRKAPSANPCTR